MPIAHTFLYVERIQANSQLQIYKCADRKDCGQFAITTPFNAYNDEYLFQIAENWYSFVYLFSPSWNDL